VTPALGATTSPLAQASIQHFALIGGRDFSAPSRYFAIVRLASTSPSRCRNADDFGVAQRLPRSSFSMIFRIRCFDVTDEDALAVRAA